MTRTEATPQIQIRLGTGCNLVSERRRVGPLSGFSRSFESA